MRDFTITESGFRSLKESRDGYVATLGLKHFATREEIRQALSHAVQLIDVIIVTAERGMVLGDGD